MDVDMDVQELAQAIYDAFSTQAEESSQWVDGWGNRSLDSVVIDGRFDLVAVAEFVKSRINPAP